MTSITTLSLLKSQLNIEHDLDDVLLQHKLEAAFGYCQSYIGDWIFEPVPAAITQAVLMLAAYWYEIREAAVVGGNAYAIPFGVHDLLQAYRRWVV